ncbi:hypothetical protein D9C73_025280 [Collichthys lucidus]|uniref:Uncharacterized protein n=1 Tax=Collichthys lucidus TaxID=240159 RepID=A0A4U5VRE4_COLLU|nr:hypothetical protein D9C73_025280 [Collichthys lucidus]
MVQYLATVANSIEYPYVLMLGEERNGLAAEYEDEEDSHSERESENDEDDVRSLRWRTVHSANSPDYREWQGSLPTSDDAPPPPIESFRILFSYITVMTVILLTLYEAQVTTNYTVGLYRATPMVHGAGCCSSHIQIKEDIWLPLLLLQLEQPPLMVNITVVGSRDLAAKAEVATGIDAQSDAETVTDTFLRSTVNLKSNVDLKPAEAWIHMNSLFIDSGSAVGRLKVCSSGYVAARSSFVLDQQSVREPSCCRCCVCDTCRSGIWHVQGHESGKGQSVQPHLVCGCGVPGQARTVLVVGGWDKISVCHIIIILLIIITDETWLKAQDPVSDLELDSFGEPVHLNRDSTVTGKLLGRTKSLDLCYRSVTNPTAELYSACQITVYLVPSYKLALKRNKPERRMVQFGWRTQSSVYRTATTALTGIYSKMNLQQLEHPKHLAAQKTITRTLTILKKTKLLLFSDPPIRQRTASPVLMMAVKERGSGEGREQQRWPSHQANTCSFSLHPTLLIMSRDFLQIQSSQRLKGYRGTRRRLLSVTAANGALTQRLLYGDDVESPECFSLLKSGMGREKIDLADKEGQINRQIETKLEDFSQLCSSDQSSTESLTFTQKTSESRLKDLNENIKSNTTKSQKEKKQTGVNYFNKLDALQEFGQLKFCSENKLTGEEEVDHSEEQAALYMSLTDKKQVLKGTAMINFRGKLIPKRVPSESCLNKRRCLNELLKHEKEYTERDTTTKPVFTFLDLFKRTKISTNASKDCDCELDRSQLRGMVNRIEANIKQSSSS